MNKVTVVFSQSLNIGSWMIRKFTQSDWSHCGLLTEEGEVLEATADHGVVATPYEKFKEKHNLIISITIETEHAAKIYELFKSQLGKRYDYTAIFSIVIGRDWQEMDAWFCSEIVAFVFYMVKFLIGEEYRKLRRITPQQIFKVLKAVGVLKTVKGNYIAAPA